MLTVEHLEKRFRDHVAVHDFSIRLEPGEFIALLGPSGSGKTTVLRMIAGLLTPSAGTVYIGERNVTNARPKDRQIGVVFQSYALFPHLTAGENIAFSLRLRRVKKNEIRDRVNELLGLMQLSHREHYYPDQMSGGERQRVALARALAFRPPLLLLDEPLSALDAKVRDSLRELLKDVQRQTGVTTLMVTHDQEEALSLADRVIVMQAGEIEQTGTPKEVYHSPETAFVSTFIGVSSTIFVTRADDGIHDVQWCGYSFHYLLNANQRRELATGGTNLYVRPEAIRLFAHPVTNTEPQGVLVFSMFLGNSTRVRVRMTDDTLLTVDVPSGKLEYTAGDRIYIQIDDSRL